MKPLARSFVALALTTASCAGSTSTSAPDAASTTGDSAATSAADGGGTVDGGGANDGGGATDAASATDAANTTDAASATDAGSTSDSAGADASPPPGKTVAEVIASFDAAACTGVQGCSPAVLTDFSVQWNQCTISKSGNTVTIARPGDKIDAIVGTFDSLQDKVTLAGNSLVIAMVDMAGPFTTISVTMNKNSGTVTSATASVEGTDGSARSIDCMVKTSGLFPTGKATTIGNTKDLLDALQHKACKFNSNGATFGKCGAAALPDFSLDINGCKLAKVGATFTLSKGSESKSAKWDEGFSATESDGMTESLVGGQFAVTWVAGETAPNGQGGTFLQMTLRADNGQVVSLLGSTMQTGQQVNQILCNP